MGLLPVGKISISLVLAFKQWQMYKTSFEFKKGGYG